MSGKLAPNLGVDAKFGTGFCLDPACEFIVTNYHVALAARPNKIEGEKIVQRYFASGPHDKGATPNIVADDVFGYATKRDLAIFALRHSLRHHHGLTFNLDELEVGQEVDIYGYPLGVINPFRKLTRFPAKFKGPTTSGLLAFDYELSTDQPIRIAGSSGGIIVDQKTEKIVGVLSGANTPEQTAIAVSIQTLVEFVTKVQPFLAQKIFPATKQIPPVSDDIYPKFVPQRPNGLLQHRPEEPHEVGVLRQHAQLLADSIRNFIAVQSFAWGSGEKAPDAEAAYEVSVIDGVQQFRSYPDGKRTNLSPPLRNGWVLPFDEWSQLPKMVGTDPRLKVRQALDVAMSGRRMKVFQYYANVEDNLCPFQPLDDYAFFTVGKPVAVACYGEVWADEDMNILRISMRLDLSEKLKAFRGWEEFHVVITYGWLNPANEPPRLAPLTIYTESSYGKHSYYCRGNFTDYRVFSVGARLLTN